MWFQQPVYFILCDDNASASTIQAHMKRAYPGFLMGNCCAKIALMIGGGCRNLFTSVKSLEGRGASEKSGYGVLIEREGARQ